MTIAAALRQKTTLCLMSCRGEQMSIPAKLTIIVLGATLFTLTPHLLAQTGAARELTELQERFENSGKRFLRRNRVARFAMAELTWVELDDA